MLVTIINLFVVSPHTQFFFNLLLIHVWICLPYFYFQFLYPTKYTSLIFRESPLIAHGSKKLPSLLSKLYPTQKMSHFNSNVTVHSKILSLLDKIICLLFKFIFSCPLLLFSPITLSLSAYFDRSIVTSKIIVTWFKTFPRFKKKSFQSKASSDAWSTFSCNIYNNKNENKNELLKKYSKQLYIFV